MNPAQFLAHFDRISDAPDAIPRLRRFILDLAVRGKLVEQDSKEEPASESLKRIAAEKMQRCRVERTKKAGHAPLEDESFPLPIGWAWVHLADLVAVLNGRAYSQNELLNAGTPVLRVGNLFTSKHWYYSNLELEEEKYCSDGDLIFAWSASFGPFIWHGPKVIYHYHIWKLDLHSNRDLDKHYLYRFLLQKTQEIKESGHGISMIHMTKEKMEKLQIPVPPLAEQHRIVAKVDELMAFCDRLEAAQVERESRRDRLVASSLNRLNNGPDAEAFHDHARFYFSHLPRLTTKPEHIQQLRQAILNLVVRGKLVPQDPNDEPAPELLKKIEQTKRQLIAARELRQGSSITNSIDRRSEISIPKSWAWTKCDKILFVTKLAGFEYTKHFELSSEGDIPVIRAQNVRPWRIDRNNLLYIDNKTSETLERSALTKPCILVTFIGAGIGDVAFFNEELRWHLAPNVAKAEVFIGCEDLLDLRYLVLFLNSPFGRAEIFKHMKSTAQPSISMGTIRDIDLAIPPLAEQQRIVAKVDELMALCDKLDAQLTTTHIDNSRLLEAVLAEQLHHDVAPMGG